MSSEGKAGPTQLREVLRIMQAVSLPPGSLPWLLRDDSPVPPLQARWSRYSLSQMPPDQATTGAAPPAQNKPGTPHPVLTLPPWLVPTLAQPPNYCLYLLSPAFWTNNRFGFSRSALWCSLSLPHPRPRPRVSLCMSLHVCVSLSLYLCLCLSVSLCL